MNIKKSLAMIAGSAIVFSFAGSVLADDEMEGMLDFQRVDTNGDECVDWEELRNASLRFFRSLDHNSDNLIAGEEHPRAVNDKGETVTPRTVDTSRFQSAIYDAFDTADKDQNGCLSRREYESD